MHNQLLTHKLNLVVAFKHTLCAATLKTCILQPVGPGLNLNVNHARKYDCYIQRDSYRKRQNFGGTQVW